MGKVEQRAGDRHAPLASSHSGASQMLEAALQQMDGIISGTSSSVGEQCLQNTSVEDAAEQLVTALCNTPAPWPIAADESAAVLRRWVGPQTVCRDTLAERIHRLEAEKEQLQLQVSVLVEQVDAQSDKLADQEGLLDERNRQLVEMEDMLQREIHGRSNLEAQRLELLSVMSDLKLQLASPSIASTRLTSPRLSSTRFASLPRQSSDTPHSRRGISLSGYAADDSVDTSCSTPNLAEASDLRRGGLRATAGPRLGWSQPEAGAPFAQWDAVAVAAWLQSLGLDITARDKHLTGAQLLDMPLQRLDKELGIKHSLHRKKLHLALLSRQPESVAADPFLAQASRLDTAWVLRWLDDTGLPQHKDAFLSSRVDGRVLHRLTMDDLATLHVTSHLHVASLRRGIQVLRSQGFAPDCLQRRSIPEEPPRVVLWSNHRVMEWLRVVDLAEYAPNLRGSGVHGGLLFHEPRFTSELLAALLAIPPGKTLLRRHLGTHFTQLLGARCIQDKREAQSTLGYVPLTPTTKLKMPKKSQFTLKRKKTRSELELGDLVCPLDAASSGDHVELLGDGTMLSPARKAAAASPATESLADIISSWSESNV